MSITAVFVSINLCEGMDAAKRNEAGQRNNGTFEKNVLSAGRHLAEWTKLAADLLGWRNDVSRHSVSGRRRLE